MPAPKSNNYSQNPMPQGGGLGQNPAQKARRQRYPPEFPRACPAWVGPYLGRPHPTRSGNPRPPAT